MRFRQSQKARLVREHAVAYMQYLYQHSSQMPYAEVRPMKSFPTPYMHVPRAPTDCSESASIVMQASGAPTPYVQARQGYTGTMLAELKHIGKRGTRRGDFAVFTSGTEPNGIHVVVFLQSGHWRRDPLVWSHGRPGVDVMPLSHMRAGFPGDQIAYLRSVPLDL